MLEAPVWGTMHVCTHTQSPHNNIIIQDTSQSPPPPFDLATCQGLILKSCKSGPPKASPPPPSLQKLILYSLKTKKVASYSSIRLFCNLIVRPIPIKISKMARTLTYLIHVWHSNILLSPPKPKWKNYDTTKHMKNMVIFSAFSWVKKIVEHLLVAI